MICPQIFLISQSGTASAPLFFNWKSYLGSFAAAMQQGLHYFLHFGFPVVIALLINKKKWFRIYLVLAATMLVDLDHLIAAPVFDPCRCSINFHPLHSYPAIAVYFFLLFFKPSRIIATGLLFHMLTDFIDCRFIWQACG